MKISFVIENTFRRSPSDIFVFATLLNREKLHKARLCTFWRNFSISKGSTLLENLFIREANRMSQKLSPFENIWLVGCFGFNSPLRQYFSLYQAASQREGERGEKIVESKNVQTTPTRTYCKHSRPLPYYHPNCRTPQHWKFTQNLRTTRPPPL